MNKPTLTININLAGLVGKLNLKLQHLSDLIKYANVSNSINLQKEYNEYTVFTCLNTANIQTLLYEKAKEFFHEWCLKNSFRDAVEHLSSFLEECYIVCAFFAARENGIIKGEAYNEIVLKNSSDFHRMNFPVKIEFLKSEFSVSSSLEEHVLSLNKVRNCLVHREGIVGKQDLNAPDALIAKFRELQILALSPDKKIEKVLKGPTVIDEGGHVAIRTQNTEKEFKLNEKIDLQPQEFANTVFTLFSFGVEIQKSISKHAGMEVG
jgi:hypothetical protein